MNKITIERQGERWIASDGERHYEAEDAMGALLLLETSYDESPEFAEHESESWAKEDVARRIENYALELIKFACLGAPRMIWRNNLESLAKQVNRFCDLQELEEGGA